MYMYARKNKREFYKVFSIRFLLFTNSNIYIKNIKILRCNCDWGTKIILTG